MSVIRDTGKTGSKKLYVVCGVAVVLISIFLIVMSVVNLAKVDDSQFRLESVISLIASVGFLAVGVLLVYKVAKANEGEGTRALRPILFLAIGILMILISIGSIVDIAVFGTDKDVMDYIILVMQLIVGAMIVVDGIRESLAYRASKAVTSAEPEDSVDKE